MLLLLYYNTFLCSNLQYYAVLDPVTKIVVHFYIDFTSRLLKQIWILAYPYGFCNPVWIHGMKINDMIWYE
jgi:hypothetical protein